MSQSSSENQLPPPLVSFLDEWLGGGWAAAPLFGDASARAYFRVRREPDTRAIVAFYPPEVHPQYERYLGAYAALSGHAPVPVILRSADPIIAQFDAGDVTLLEVLRADHQRGLDFYRKAIDLMVSFRDAEKEGADLNPPFTASFFAAELEMTLEFYVGALMQAPVTEDVREVFERLCERLARHPYVLCHRDYHGENLHVFDDELYLLDFQDMRMGPDTYDLSSLLRDRGVLRLLGPSNEGALLDHYQKRVGVDPGVRKRYLETLLQRSLKILGTFAKQAVTRERYHYLNHISAAIEAIRFSLDHLPEYRDLEESFPLAFERDRFPQSTN